jgi:hypothetical protein
MMLLKDSDLLEIVNITAVECYVNHIIPSAHVSDIEINDMRLVIGRVCSLYKELVSDRLITAENGHNQEIADRILVTKNALKNNMDLLPNLETLQTYNLSCSSDTFLEILIMSVKNSSLAHQHDFFKIKNAKKIMLENKLRQLKKEFHANTAEILRTERDLKKVTEGGMREEVLRMRNFEQLNNEKITPYFLSLAKKPHNSESLLDIRRNDGEVFDNSLERDNYIRNYFADTYKKVPDTVTEQSINHFLGDVAEHPDVLSSKLSPDERDS